MERTPITSQPGTAPLPPGLKDLKNLDEITVHQHLEAGDSMYMHGVVIYLDICRNVVICSLIEDENLDLFSVSYRGQVTWNFFNLKNPAYMLLIMQVHF